MIFSPQLVRNVNVYSFIIASAYTLTFRSHLIFRHYYFEAVFFIIVLLNRKYILNKIINKETIICLKKFAIRFSIFLIYAVAISLYSGISESFYKYLYYLSFFPLVFFSGFICGKNSQKYLTVLYIFSSIYFIFGFFKLLFFGFKQGEFNTVFFYFLEKDGVKSYQNESLFLGFFSIYSLNLSINSNKNISKAFLFCVFMTSFYLLSVIGGRSALLACAISSFLLITMFIRKKSGLLLFFIALLILTCFLFENSTGFLRIKTVIQSINLEKMFSSNEITISNDPSQRIDLFIKSFKMWTSNFKTFFLGAGMGSFQKTFFSDNFGLYPHNFALDILSSVGIFGTLLFFRSMNIDKSYKYVNIRNIPYDINFIILLYFLIISFATGSFSNSYFFIFSYVSYHQHIKNHSLELEKQGV